MGKGNAVGARQHTHLDFCSVFIDRVQLDAFLVWSASPPVVLDTALTGPDGMVCFAHKGSVGNGAISA